MPGSIQVDYRNGAAMTGLSGLAGVPSFGGDGANDFGVGDDHDGSGSASADELLPIQEFVVVNQEVFLDVDFTSQSIQGESRITIYLINPNDPPDEVALDARQCTIDTSQVRVNGKPVRTTYVDPYEALDVPDAWNLSPTNFPVFKNRMKNLMPRRRRDLAVEKREQVGCSPADRSLRVRLRPEPPQPPPPRSAVAGAVDQQQPGRLKLRLSNIAVQDSISVLPPLPQQDKTQADQPTDGLFEIVIPFYTTHVRDGLHFVGVEENDTRFPHVYTRHSPEPGIAACIFPCIDDPGSRCFWKIHIKCPRTLGDALTEDQPNQSQQQEQPDDTRRLFQLTEEDKLLDMTVVCSGNLVGEKVDEKDETKKIMTFEITDHGSAAHHIGFAIGPFEHVDLFSGFRTDEADEKLGASALKIHGYCLPGRQAEVLNTCASLALAADEFAMAYGRYPYDSFKLCFVDDMIPDTTPLLSFGLCSNRLLFPDTIVERDLDVTRQLVHSLAYQYFGSYIVPNLRSEMWLTVGIAYYMTDLFLAKLCGNNDYRFRIKAMADRLADEDRERPSLADLGTYAYLGDFEMDFMALKAPLVLFILDKRLTKAAGSASASLARVISKIISKANTSGWGDNNNEIISSESFRRVCEKTSQYPLDTFWNQWVLGSGCPWLSVKQRFNRKRLCVEISVHQLQEAHAAKPRPMQHTEFWRELVEKRHGTYPQKVQRLFTGPMTIRIHEANGTPYEHIVEIREDAALTGSAKFDIPYNTKYKRLKRNRRNRERAAALAAALENGAGGGADAGGNDELIVFALGDKLEGQEEMALWELMDWTEQDEKSMDQESYEWIRIDSDFEWVSKTHTNMPAWMYLSQLQQDRDIVAQQDTLLYLSRIREHPMSATILTRTLYDDRYFYRLRTMAAENLARQVWPSAAAAADGDGDGSNETGGSGPGGGADDSIVYRGLNQLIRVYRTFFCYDDATCKPNDFSDMRQYWVQCAIVDAIAKVHYEDKQPREARRFLLDLLRFNDNSQNPFSDHLFVAKLLVALATSFCPPTDGPGGANKTNGSGAKQKQKQSASNARNRDMPMVLTFDDRLSDSDDADGDDENDVFNLGGDMERMEVDTEDQQLLASALDEIERYRRMDDWVGSYQNVWTTAALEAKKRMMKAGIIPVDALEFVRYLQDGTIESVQLKAFEALIDLGLMLRPVLLKLLLTTMTTHASPFVRDRLFKLFCTGLASIAFGEHDGGGGDGSAAGKDAARANGSSAASKGTGANGDVSMADGDDDDDGGIIVQGGDAITKKHQEEHARRESLDAAVAALKQAVKDNKELQAAIWNAVRSPVTGCTEKRNLLDLMDRMFDGETSLLLTVPYPMKWVATDLQSAPGSIVLSFKKVPRPLKASPAAAAVQPQQLPQPTLAPAPTSSIVAKTEPMADALIATPIFASSAGSVAVAGLPASAAPLPQPQRTALPDLAKKSAAPRIKLQTRVSLNGSGPAGAAAETTATPATPTGAAAVRTASASTAIRTLLPNAVADSISVRPIVPRRDSSASVARRGSAVTSPTAEDRNGNGLGNGLGNGSLKMLSRSPSFASVMDTSDVSASSNKRKRENSRDEGAPERTRKLLKIRVPASFPRKLSASASHWLKTVSTTPETTGAGIKAPTPPSAGSSSSRKPSWQGNVHGVTSVPTPAPSAGSSFASQPLPPVFVKAEVPTPPSSQSQAFYTAKVSPTSNGGGIDGTAPKPARKPLPMSGAAWPASTGSATAVAAAATPAVAAADRKHTPTPPPPPAAPAAAPAAPAPAPKPTIVIKFKRKP